MKTRIRRCTVLAAAALASLLLATAPAFAGTDSCRIWRSEHAQWKARVLGLTLRGASQARIDAALFEVLQREAYLTSCGVSARQSRAQLVGWRLVGRARAEYAAAVVESVLEVAGFDMDLSRRLGISSSPVRRVARR